VKTNCRWGRATYAGHALAIVAAGKEAGRAASLGKPDGCMGIDRQRMSRSSFSTWRAYSHRGPSASGFRPCQRHASRRWPILTISTRSLSSWMLSRIRYSPTRTRHPSRWRRFLHPAGRGSCASSSMAAAILCLAFRSMRARSLVACLRISILWAKLLFRLFPRRRSDEYLQALRWSEQRAILLMRKLPWSLDFIAQLTLHIPPRSRGTGKNRPAQP
jgi:hypothetical protein